MREKLEFEQGESQRKAIAGVTIRPTLLNNRTVSPYCVRLLVGGTKGTVKGCSLGVCSRLFVGNA
jgi:hypothetical protein